MSTRQLVNSSTSKIHFFYRYGYGRLYLALPLLQIFEEGGGGVEGAGEGLVVGGEGDVVVDLAKGGLYHVGVVVAVGRKLLHDVG